MSLTPGARLGPYEIVSAMRRGPDSALGARPRRDDYNAYLNIDEASD
jgi:hypothetical protein